MQFCFSSETPSNFNTHYYPDLRLPLYSNSQDPCLEYFNFDQAKQPIFFCENQTSSFVDSAHTGGLSPSNFTSMDEQRPTPSYFQGFFEKDHFCDTLPFNSNFKCSRNGFDFQNNQTSFFPNPTGTFAHNLKNPFNENNNLKYKQIPSPESDTIAADISQTTSDSPHLNKTYSDTIDEIGSATIGSETNEEPGHAMKGWNEDDEKLLRQLTVQYKFDWKKIAKKFDNKKYTPHFLKMRYKGYDEGPVPKRVKFTHEEDMMIAQYFAEYGVDWEKMATHFTNRTPVMIKNRYYSHIRKNKRLESLLKEVKRQETASEELNTSCSAINDCLDFEITIKSGDCFETKLEMSEEDARKSDLVALLRAQVKSLKSLYLNAHKELMKLKNKRVRGKPNYLI